MAVAPSTRPGSLAHRVLPDGRVLDLWPEFTTVRLTISADLVTEEADDQWQYQNWEAAVTALEGWDGSGEPEGWYRHPTSGRRRPGGDPAQEIVWP